MGAGMLVYDVSGDPLHGAAELFTLTEPRSPVPLGGAAEGGCADTGTRSHVHGA